jgi:Domain of unknown function (DUF4159)
MGNPLTERRPRRWLAVLAIAAVALALTAELHAQFRQRGFGGRGFGNVRKATAADFDGTFQFCRVAFASDGRGDGGGWSADFPRADINLSIRLSELTKTRIGRDSDEEPTHLLIQLTDPELFDCPFIMMTEVGAASFRADEVANLRAYLEKGGFLWADDFWGTDAWDWWEEQLHQVLPADQYPIVDVEPGHALYHAQFDIKDTPQITNIGFWTRTGGGTSERGADSAVVHTRGVFDKNGRMMVLMTHNTDFGDAFEREGDDPAFFYAQSVPGYGFGINVLLYTMTH